MFRGAGVVGVPFWPVEAHQTQQKREDLKVGIETKDTRGEVAKIGCGKTYNWHQMSKGTFTNPMAKIPIVK